MKKPNYSKSKKLFGINDIRKFIVDNYGEDNYYESFFSQDNCFGWYNKDESGEPIMDEELGNYSCKTFSGYVYYPKK